MSQRMKRGKRTRLFCARMYNTNVIKQPLEYKSMPVAPRRDERHVDKIITVYISVLLRARARVF